MLIYAQIMLIYEKIYLTCMLDLFLKDFQIDAFAAGLRAKQSSWDHA